MGQKQQYHGKKSCVCVCVCVGGGGGGVVYYERLYGYLKAPNFGLQNEIIHVKRLFQSKLWLTFLSNQIKSFVWYQAGSVPKYGIDIFEKCDTNQLSVSIID